VAIRYVVGRIAQALVTLVLFMVVIFVATRAAGILPFNLPPGRVSGRYSLARQQDRHDRTYMVSSYSCGHGDL
jgi:hypothetical protein